MHRARKFEKFAPLRLYQISFGFSILLPLFSTKRERRSAIRTLQNCCLSNASRCSSVTEALLMHSIKTLIQKQDRQAAPIYGRATRPRMVQV